MSTTTESPTTPPDEAAPPTGQASGVIVATNTHVVVDELSPRAAEQLRDHVEEASSGGSRFVWFSIGFLSALAIGAASAIGFLAVSDEDDDGSINVEVPTVQVDAP